MSPLIASHREELLALCRRFGVRRLDLFGSAPGEHFDPAVSNLDFVVEFEDLEPGAYADAYFGLLKSLEGLFQRHDDLVMASAMKNPYYRRSIEQTRATLYAA